MGKIESILKSEPIINAWIEQIINNSRKSNFSITGIGGEILIFKKDGYKEIVDLKQEEEVIKNKLYSIKEKFHIPSEL